MLSSPAAVERFLLSRPEAFDVMYEINPFMDPSVPVDHDRAVAQWTAFKERLVEAGASVEVQASASDCPDLVFAANAALIMDGRALLSRFRYPERSPEVAHNRVTLGELRLDVLELPPHVQAFEGAADAMALPESGAILSAWGTRTSREAIPFVEDFTGLRAVPIELPDPRFYHLDLVTCLLDAEHALVVPEAMSPDSYERFREVVPRPLELTLKEGLSFCANSVVVSRTVFMHRVPPRVRELLTAAGFTAVETPATEFVKGGGSLACMALRIDRESGRPAHA